MKFGTFCGSYGASEIIYLDLGSLELQLKSWPLLGIPPNFTSALGVHEGPCKELRTSRHSWEGGGRMRSKGPEVRLLLLVNP